VLQHAYHKIITANVVRLCFDELVIDLNVTLSMLGPSAVVPRALPPIDSWKERNSEKKLRRVSRAGAVLE